MGVVATSALLFAARVAGTVAWCGSDCCGGVPMPGGWTLASYWLIAPGRTWLSAAAAFMGMWAVMMPAMMLPSLVPTLRLRPRAALVGAGYFAVWIALGALIYPLGRLLAGLELRSPAFARCIPFLAGIVVILGGCYQWTPWKLGHLSCCRAEPMGGSPWRDGLRYGLRCNLCCLGFTAFLLANGAMDLIVMGVVTVGITAERVLPRSILVARVLGALAIAWGVVSIARAYFSS